MPKHAKRNQVPRMRTRCSASAPERIGVLIDPRAYASPCRTWRPTATPLGLNPDVRPLDGGIGRPMSVLDGTSRASVRPPGALRRPRAKARLARWLLATSVALGPTLGGSASERPARPAEGGSELESLLQHFSTMTGFSARFREERRLALLQEPLVSSGTVYFAPPGRLVRRGEEPLASTLPVQGSEITFGRADEVHSPEIGTASRK